MYPRITCNQGRNTWLRAADVVAKDSCCVGGVSNSCCLGVVSNRILPTPVNLVLLLLLYLPRVFMVCVAGLSGFKGLPSPFLSPLGRPRPLGAASGMLMGLSFLGRAPTPSCLHFRADHNCALNSLKI